MKRRTPQTHGRIGIRERLIRLITDGNRERPEMRPSRRTRPHVERLEDRRLLAATDLAAITGLVFNDATGNGFNAGEQVANVALDLYRDANNNGTFEPGGADDPVFRTTMTGADGRYTFDRLSAGNYFVLQRAQTASGVALPRSESSLIVISATDVQGRPVRTIDSFNQTTQTVSDTTNDNIPVTSAMLAPEAIGGERDLFVSKTSNDGEVQISANNPLQPNRLSFNEQLGGDGIQRVSWDGPDGNANTIADNGLPAADRDLTSGGDALGFSLLIRSDSGQSNAVLRLYSDDGVAGTANRFSAVSIPIQNAASGTQVQEFIPFSSFSAISGGGASISNVGAIELEITGDPDVDGTVSLVGTVGQTFKTQDFANFQSADLSLTKTVDDATPSLNQNVTFTITTNNAGPSAATNVSVRDVLPAGLTFVSSTPSQGTYNAATGVWTVGTINALTSASLSLTATVVGQGSRTNVAEVIAADQTDINSTPNNNSPGENDQASVTLTPASADLSLSKAVDIASPNVGQNVNFTIIVTNSGPDTATGVSVRDLLPAGNTFVAASPSVGNYEPSTGIWTIGTIGVGNSATLNLVVTAQNTGLAVNTAEVFTSNQSDPDSTPGNNIPAEDDQDSAQIQPQQIDLFLNKTVSNSSPNVGQSVNFVITVGNSGPSTATGVAVTESLPPGVTLLSSSPSQGSFNTSTGVWTVGSISTGGQATLTLTTRVDSIGSGTNSAEVTAANQSDIDSTPGNNIASEDDQASVTFTTQVADLSLTKTASNTAPNIGEQVSFEVIVSNAGPDTATNLQVADALPSGLAFVSNTLSSGTYNPASGVWAIGSLAPSTSATLTVLATVNSQGTKTNTARVTAVDQADPDSTPGNNVASEDDQASVDVTPPVIDLSLTKSASPARPAVGQNLTYILTVANAGPQSATGVEIVDVLPAGLSFISSTPSTGSYDAATGRWTVGSIASGSNATLQVLATVNTVDFINNSAQVTAANEFDLDSTPGNNIPTEDDQASVVVTPARADLSLSKTINDASPNLGAEVTFTLTATNAGPDDAANIAIRDSLPLGMTFVASTPSLGTYDGNTGQWTIPALANGGSATLQIRARVDTIGDKTNTAEIIASSQFDPDSTPGNNIATEDDQASVVLSPELVDLALTKSVSDLTPNVGDTIQYLLSLTNAGPSTATGVVVTDELGSGVTFTQATPSRGTYNPNTGVWAVGDVPVGETPTLTLVAVVNDTRSETNTAEITAADQPDVDSTPGNNVAGEDDIAAVTFNTLVADLSLTKVVDNDTPNMSDNVTFTLTLSNAGPDAATDVMISDRIPAGLRFVSATPSIGTYDSTTGIWSVPTVPVGSITSLQVVTAVTSAAPILNIAEVASSRQFDPDSTPGNNLVGEDDRAQVDVMPQVVDLSVNASVDNETPLEGETIQIVFRASNAGPADATNVQLNTLLPTGLTLISSQPQTGAYDSATGDWDVGRLAANASTQLTLNARVDTRGFKQIPIQVTTTDQFDIDSTPGNNIAAEDDQVELVVRAPRLLQKRLFMSR